MYIIHTHVCAYLMLDGWVIVQECQKYFFPSAVFFFTIFSVGFIECGGTEFFLLRSGRGRGRCPFCNIAPHTTQSTVPTGSDQQAESHVAQVMYFISRAASFVFPARLLKAILSYTQSWNRALLRQFPPHFF